MQRANDPRAAKSALAAVLAGSVLAAGPSTAAADEGELHLGVATAAGLPVMGYLGPKGTYDYAARVFSGFQLTLDYELTPLIALELATTLGTLTETADGPPATCLDCPEWDGRGTFAFQGAFGPKLRLGSSRALSIAAHVGVYRWDGWQPGGDATVGYDFEMGERAALTVGLQGWLMFGGRGDPRQPQEAHADAALLLSLGGRFDFLSGGPSDPDGDGLSGRGDECPDAAEDADGFQDGDGCPDLDNDGDGVPDAVDGSDSQAEDGDGFEDGDGVPDPDNDGDGVLDAEDDCPVAAGTAATRGCPVMDEDLDGIADLEDQCPSVPGESAHRGCPPPAAPEPTAQIVADRVEISDTIYFDVNGEQIEARSLTLLDRVAALMIEHPEVARLRIEGHTDESGTSRQNRALALRRANAVRAYLVGKGVQEGRLEAVGIGSDRPVVPNATNEADHARNRRVEFHIVAR